MTAHNPAFLADMAKGVTSLAICWHVLVPGRPALRGTDFDRGIAVTQTDSTLLAVRPTLDLAGTYSSYAGIGGSDMRHTSDTSVSNMEIQGAVADPESELIGGITVADIESGLLNGARAHVFYLNWRAPDAWQKTIAFGNFGQFSRDSDGLYRTEIRGLLQRLSQSVGDAATEGCIVQRFGDSRCKKNVVAITRAGVVTAATNRKAFQVSLTPDTAPPIADYFKGGRVTFTSGDNEDFEFEAAAVVVADGVATILLWDEAPADIEVGDTLDLEPRCNRTASDCKMHGNFVNFQGYGLFMAGAAALMKGPVDAAPASAGNPSAPAFVPRPGYGGGG
jgi:uncharacterized phage protein (TIGR02218 family)